MLRRALVLTLLLAPAVARANGRFPQVVGVHFKPGDHQTMALGVSWGLLTTDDGGQTWSWNCEEAIGFGGVYDPDYAYTSTGVLLATTTSPDAMRITHDRCDWAPAAVPLAPNGDTTFIAQVEVGPDDTIYAAAATATDSQLYVSTDEGVSFQVRSLPGGAHADWWKSMKLAPSTNGATTRIYLSGFNLPPGDKVRLLYRSDDAGQTWTPLPVTDFSFGSTTSDLSIAAVSPTDPDLLFARVSYANGSSVGDDLYRSANAGASWTRVAQSSQNITGVLVRLNGQVLYSERPAAPGLPAPGPVHTSTDGGQTFDAGVTDKEIDCLEERDDGVVYGCGNSFDPDDMALGTGGPGAWTTVVDFANIARPVSCASGTPQHDVCEVQRWPQIVCQFGISYPGVTCSNVDAGAPDAGLVNPPGHTCADCSSSGGAGSALLALAVLGLVSRRRLIH